MSEALDLFVLFVFFGVKQFSTSPRGTSFLSRSSLRLLKPQGSPRETDQHRSCSRFAMRFVFRSCLSLFSGSPCLNLEGPQFYTHARSWNSGCCANLFALACCGARRRRLCNSLIWSLISV